MSRGDISVRHGLDRLTVLIKANRCTKLIIKVYENYTAGCRNGETVSTTGGVWQFSGQGYRFGYRPRDADTPIANVAHANIDVTSKHVSYCVLKKLAKFFIVL